MAYRYFFDRLPFELDPFSQFLGGVAQANAEAGERYPANRAAVREAVDEALVREMGIMAPKMPSDSVIEIVSRMPAGLRHPAFGPAWLKIKEAAAYQSSVMALPGEVAAGVVMAALGVPAAPLLGTSTDRIIDPTLDIDVLIEETSKLEQFMIGFEPAFTDFYFLVSTSVRSLRRCLESDPGFKPIRHIIPMSRMPLTPKPTGTWGLHPKSLSDRISTIVHKDNPGGGLTTIFIGGWVENGVPRDHGFPTCQPMPMRILEYIMRHGAAAFTLMKLEPGQGLSP
ncbi:hypothetical protein [Sphingomonas oryzagri]